MVRVLNLSTGDEAAAPVRSDGSFGVRLFAPAGSFVQITSNMLARDQLPRELRAALEAQGKTALEGLNPETPGAELIAGHWSCSPGAIIAITEGAQTSPGWPAMVRKIGPERWLIATATPAQQCVSPGDTVEVELTVSVLAGPDAESVVRPLGPLVVRPHLHCLFDAEGRQRPYGRLPLSAVQTPTGIPIETHGEMLAEPDGRGGKTWHLGGVGLPLLCRLGKLATWRQEGNRRIIHQQAKLEIPARIPSGIYGLGVSFPGIGNEEYGALEPANHPGLVCRLTVGSPAPPRLVCLLLGSAGTAGSRGTIAREDRGHFGINMKSVFSPEKLVIPRDDVFTSRPWTYPLDPYLPLVSTAVRPLRAAIPPPLIPLDVAASRLTVWVQAPSGARHQLGPAPLRSGQNDMSVLRPDYVAPDRLIPPVRPAYGNPGMSDIYHLTGRGAFDYAFQEYGHHVVRLEGRIADMAGWQYAISGTYDVYVAQPLDLEIFPEPGTPLEVDVGLCPQVRVFPPLPADVEVHFRQLPYSDEDRAVERTIRGSATRGGVFVPAAEEPPLRFDEPGEYVCDVTVRHTDADGALWMACRRGASVVITPDSRVLLHGERGNRSPHARWRARWFVAGDGRFVAPTAQAREGTPPALQATPEERLNRVDLGHTCLPYEPGDVAWLGSSLSFSLFPGITFEDPDGTLAQTMEARWPAVREGAGREGLYPHHLKPEDRRAIGEMPYVCMTRSGLPPSIDPRQIDLWGYFYFTSWRPGVSVRTLVAEDAQPVGYWFFDDPYAWQFGNGPHGDLPGDFKMNYAGGVLRDAATGRTHYGGYASMLVLIDGNDPRGARVLPPFNGLLPGSPPCGALLEIGGRRYDAFLTFGPVGPGAVLEVGDRLLLAGVMWPPISGCVRGEFVTPRGKRTGFDTRVGPLGVFEIRGPVLDEPGLWQIPVQGICSGTTSAGTISDLVPQADWPRGSGVGLAADGVPIAVLDEDAPGIEFDLPPGAKASPPAPLVLRGRLPAGTRGPVNVLVGLPGLVVDQRVLPAPDGVFEYVYDPAQLRASFPNIDTRVEVPQGGFEHAPAWFDTVTFTFWAGAPADFVAGIVLLQGEQIYASSRWEPGDGPKADRQRTDAASRASRAVEIVRGNRASASDFPADSSACLPTAAAGCARSSPLVLSRDGGHLFAAHRWSGEVVRLVVAQEATSITARRFVGGEPNSLALGPREDRLYVALAASREIVILHAQSLEILARFPLTGEPWAVLPSDEQSGLLVAEFDRDRILRLNARSGEIESTSEPITRPACLARDGQRRLYAASFRTGEIFVLDERCRLLRRVTASQQLNQCRSLTIGPDGRLWAPQTRSDTLLGGRMFDRSVFPVVAVLDPGGRQLRIEYFPDLLVVPPHRPAEVAVEEGTLYLASAGSDDVLAIDQRTGWARWHARNVGQEPGAIVWDSARRRLHVLTVTSQEIVTLNSIDGEILGRTRYAHDPTPPTVARGRYLFGTATDTRLTKDQWMSCAVCHPNGEEDGRQWDFGQGPLDTRSLRGCLRVRPLHFDAHLDEIQDTCEFTRMVMAGQWFVSQDRMHPLLGESNAGLDADLDALAAYVASLDPREPPAPPSRHADLRAAGREIFFSAESGCAECHPPPYYTDSGNRNPDGRFVRHDVGTRGHCADERLRELDTPSLLGLHGSAPYLHDGRAETLEEVLTKFNPHDRHGRTSHLTGWQTAALCEFLRYLRPPGRTRTGDGAHRPPD